MIFPSFSMIFPTSSIIFMFFHEYKTPSSMIFHPFSHVFSPSSEEGLRRHGLFAWSPRSLQDDGQGGWVNSGTPPNLSLFVIFLLVYCNSHVPGCFDVCFIVFPSLSVFLISLPMCFMFLFQFSFIYSYVHHMFILFSTVSIIFNNSPTLFHHVSSVFYKLSAWFSMEFPWFAQHFPTFSGKFPTPALSSRALRRSSAALPRWKSWIRPQRNNWPSHLGSGSGNFHGNLGLSDFQQLTYQYEICFSYFHIKPWLD